MKSKLKRMFVDIETCPNLGWFWKSSYKCFIPPENILQERRIICICWKWEGEKKVHSLDWGALRDDKTLLKKFIPELNQADEVVFQNGDKFDLPWIKGRALYYRIPMYPVYRTFDTYKKSKAHFNLNSYKLDYVQKFLGGKGKTSTGGSKLWENVTFGNKVDSKKALTHMVKYCKNDVKELEEFYHIIAPYVPHNTHAGVHEGSEKYSCPECGGISHLKVKKYYTTPSGIKRIQLECSDTVSHNTEMPRYYTVNSLAYKKYLKEKT